MTGINDFYEQQLNSKFKRLSACLEGFPVEFIPKSTTEIVFKLHDYLEFILVSQQYLKDPTGSGLVCLLNTIKMRYPDIDLKSVSQIWEKLDTSAKESIVTQRICAINAFDELFDKLEAKLYL